MSDVIMYLSFCVAGYVIGVPLRKVKDKLKGSTVGQAIEKMSSSIGKLFNLQYS